VKRGVSIAVLVAVLAGCGSGASTYSVAKTRACLVAHGATIVPPVGDLVASTATGGAIRARLTSNFVTLAFGETVAQANNINDAYHTFAAKNVGLLDVLDQQRNAVLLWHIHPQPADVDLVQACLK
jgi:hypothetical protein